MLSNYFYETYVLWQQARLGYPHLMLCHVSKGSPEKYVNEKTKQYIRVIYYDEMNYYCVPITPKMVRFIKSLNFTTSKSYHALYNILLKRLTEYGIRELYYEVWRRNKIYLAEEESKNPEIPKRVDKEIFKITHNGLKKSDIAKSSIS